jgi:hypothetical protein
MAPGYRRNERPNSESISDRVIHLWLGSRTRSAPAAAKETDHGSCRSSGTRPSCRHRHRHRHRRGARRLPARVERRRSARRHPGGERRSANRPCGRGDRRDHGRGSGGPAPRHGGSTDPDAAAHPAHGRWRRLLVSLVPPFLAAVETSTAWWLVGMHVAAAIPVLGAPSGALPVRREAARAAGSGGQSQPAA